MRTLFIGGPWDGRLIEYKLEGQTLHVPEHRASIRNYTDPVKLFSPIVQVTYVRTNLLGYVFMIEQSVYEHGTYGGKHPAEVIADLLCQGYRRPSNIFGDI